MKFHLLRFDEEEKNLGSCMYFGFASPYALPRLFHPTLTPSYSSPRYSKSYKINLSESAFVEFSNIQRQNNKMNERFFHACALKVLQMSTHSITQAIKRNDGITMVKIPTEYVSICLPIEINYTQSSDDTLLKSDRL